MSSISIRKIGITKLHVDAIVNAANDQLAAGGGVCGAIFKEAGYDKLTAACDAIGGCKTGGAVITPGFDLPAKYIIHAVGPVYIDGNHHEPQLLYSAYEQSLLRAKENGCHSIGFPLISAGIFGYPKKDAWRKALQACRDFIADNPDYDIDITFAVLEDDIKKIGEKTLEDLEKSDPIDSDQEQKADPGQTEAMTEEQYNQAVSFWTRKDAEEKKMDPDAVFAWINEFLSSHKILALATGAEDFIRCTPLEYGWHDGSLWIFTEGGLKFKALKNNQHIAAAVFELNGEFGKLKSVQIEGKAEIIPLFSEDYCKAAEQRKIPIDALKKLSEPMWLLRITPEEITCLNSDFRKEGYGSRQIWKRS